MKKLDMMRAIKERGFMAKDVADKLGITTVAMSLRTNAKNPRLDTMVQIAEVIGCDITDLFYSEETEEKDDLFSETHPEHTETAPSNVPVYLIRENGLVSENQQNGGKKAEGDVIKASAFCPHCGKKVRVGVILMDDE